MPHGQILRRTKLLAHFGDRAKGHDCEYESLYYLQQYSFSPRLLSLADHPFSGLTCPSDIALVDWKENLTVRAILSSLAVPKMSVDATLYTVARTCGPI